MSRTYRRLKDADRFLLGRKDYKGKHHICDYDLEETLIDIPYIMSFFRDGIISDKSIVKKYSKTECNERFYNKNEVKKFLKDFDYDIKTFNRKCVRDNIYWFYL